jgi:hypothetical protein
MSTVFVLIMIFGGASQSGFAVVQQEFNSLETCEAARASLATAHDRMYAGLKAHGCFRK